ncbi:unnamed protein product [Microthlaspi erraticum]|uniref:F-box domain-containing protein n=1 Tax=Microthlaspi erraticum TaxID=1685480 RepID=A0A6D2HY56_9BRAS|nr:unnamed protein product [Microthlaspi erraticum]
MAMQLPWELEEEILCRLPIKSLVRFRAVSKRWNGVHKDKTFQNKHLSRSRPQFIFLTSSKTYSIDILNPNSNDPTVERTKDGAQLLYVKNGPRLFYDFGLGYDNSKPDKVYKILGYFYGREYHFLAAIYDCASQALKFIDTPEGNWLKTETAEPRKQVSLNGNLYWFSRDMNTLQYSIRSFDFSADIFKTFCKLLPCHINHHSDKHLLAVYKRDRFSLLNQCDVTRKVEVWVTKNKIDKEEQVVWIKLMTLPRTILPMLYISYYHISYFIYDKTIFMCCDHDKDLGTWIYILRGDMCKKMKIHIQMSVNLGRYHCVSTPSLTSIPLFSG